MADLFENPLGLDGFEFVEFSAPEKGMLEPVFEGYRAENKHYATIAIGCTGGKHRSVAVTEEVAPEPEPLPWSAGHIPANGSLGSASLSAST